MKNDYIKSVVVLSAICLVVATLLAGINYITAPIIEENAAKAEHDSLYKVLPEATEFRDVVVPSTVSESVTAIYKDEGGTGYAVAVSCTSQYSKSPMTFTVGVSPKGEIIAIELTNYGETKGFGDYPQQFEGLDAKGVSSTDLVAGVTYSSRAFRIALSDALQAVKEVWHD